VNELDEQVAEPVRQAAQLLLIKTYPEAQVPMAVAEVQVKALLGAILLEIENPVDE